MLVILSTVSIIIELNKLTMQNSFISLIMAIIVLV